MTTRDKTPSRIHMSLVGPLSISAALVAPFIGLQWLSSSNFLEEFPLVLFAFMYFNSLFFVLSLTPVLRRLRAERSFKALNFGHWSGLVLGVFLGHVYAGVVVDQLPCFLGVPNCD